MIRKFFPTIFKFQNPLFTPYVKNTFCIYQAYLNPEKHILMGHNVNNVYEDIVMLGDVILPNRYAVKQSSDKYFNSLTRLVFDHLNQKYKTNLKPENIDQYYTKSWAELGIDINAEKQFILRLLSKNIFLSEHKFRWPLEQRYRLAHTTAVFSYFDVNKYMVGFFFEAYNGLINISVKRSHLWHSPAVKGDTSFLEKFVTDHSDPPTGVANLQRQIPENSNILNRFINYIHS